MVVTSVIVFFKKEILINVMCQGHLKTRLSSSVVYPFRKTFLQTQNYFWGQLLCDASTSRLSALWKGSKPRQLMWQNYEMHNHEISVWWHPENETLPAVCLVTCYTENSSIFLSLHLPLHADITVYVEQRGRIIVCGTDTQWVGKKRRNARGVITILLFALVPKKPLCLVVACCVCLNVLSPSL